MGSVSTNTPSPFQSIPDRRGISRSCETAIINEWSDFQISLLPHGICPGRSLMYGPISTAIEGSVLCLESGHCTFDMPRSKALCCSVFVRWPQITMRSGITSSRVRSAKYGVRLIASRQTSCKPFEQVSSLAEDVLPNLFNGWMPAVVECFKF